MEKVIKVTLQGGGSVVYIPVSAIGYVQTGTVFLKGKYNASGTLHVNETADQMGAQMR